MDRMNPFQNASNYAAQEIMKSKDLKTFRVGVKYQVTRKNFLEWMEKGGEVGGSRNG